MKFNMILNHNVKILGVGLILNSVIHGMDKDVHPLVSSTSSAIVESALSPRFVDVVEPNAAAKFFFPEILGKARLGYVRKCMPHLDETQLTIAAEILSRIINDGQSQILDAEKIKKNVNGNIIRTDFGYSFPPILKIQGAFLSRCRPKINVLDIGAEFLSANSEGGLLHTIYYGRHFHTGDTLRDYLSLQFDVIDCAVVRSELNEPFISVIARKRPVNV